jgi:RNA polymerase sigma factor (sigma-70 family)
MLDDVELLRRYVDRCDQNAFATLVDRHLGLVFSAALRRTNGNVHLAEDISQLVFNVLAQKATSVVQHPVLIGWIFQTTRHCANQVMRAERRRMIREHETHVMNQLLLEEPQDWETLKPVIDDVLGELGRRDVEAVLMRFIERRRFSEIGARL